MLSACMLVKSQHWLSMTRKIFQPYQNDLLVNVFLFQVGLADLGGGGELVEDNAFQDNLQCWHMFIILKKSYSNISHDIDMLLSSI